ncbi:hypothetical protein D3C86_1126120 [compost metagenome]
MRAVVSGFGLACGLAVGVAAMVSSAAWGQVPLKDQSVERPYRDSFVVVGSDSRLRAGMEVRELSDLTQRVSEQAKALEALRAKNEALTRKVDEQARKIANLERRQDDGGRGSDSQKGELDKLTRTVNSQKSELDKLSRSLDELRRRVK